VLGGAEVPDHAQAITLELSEELREPCRILHLFGGLEPGVERLGAVLPGPPLRRARAVEVAELLAVLVVADLALGLALEDALEDVLVTVADDAEAAVPRGLVPRDLGGLDPSAAGVLIEVV